MTPSSQPPRSTEPMFNVPASIVALIGLCVVVHIIRLALSPEADLMVLLDFAFIPARVPQWLDPRDFARLIAGAAQSLGPEAAELQASLARLIEADPGLKPWTFVTYALLHGSWMHLVLNAVWLLAFGSPLARRFGPVRLTVFLMVTAVAGAAAHLVSHWTDATPMIGASAAVSGCMAAAARFVFRPIGMPIFLGEDRNNAFRLPAQSLSDVFSDQRAVMFLAAWFGINLLVGLAAVPLGISEGGIAWQAHIGGFAAGLLLFPLFDPIPAVRRL